MWNGIVYKFEKTDLIPYPAYTIDSDNWLNKQTYLYALCHDGRLYHPKHILSTATGIPTTDFSGWIKPTTSLDNWDVK
jgi:hypothetical protein